MFNHTILNKKVLSIEEDAVNYRVTLDLTQILSALVEHDDVATKFTMMRRIPIPMR